MKELLIYISHATLLIAFTYIIYRLVFARDASHNMKRFVLIFLLVISFALPAFRITIHKEVVIENTLKETAAADAKAAGSTAPTTRPGTKEKTPFDWFMLASIGYLAGLGAQILFRLAGIRKVRTLMKRTVDRHYHEGIEVLILPDDIPAFNFGRKIIMSQEDYYRNRDMIIAHELIHIRQRHGIDLIFINLVQALQWFNPLIWLLRRELILVHEFSADRGVIQNGIDVKKYQYLLISKIACSRDFIPVVNHFRSSDLRKRIRHMKKRPKRPALLKLLFIIPLISLALAAFAQTEYVVVKGNTGKQEKEQFHMPYEGRIRRAYGKQIDPISRAERMHIGVDIIVTNDTVRAPYLGIVTYAAHPTDGYGNKMVIAHNGAVETTYAHLAGFLVAEGTPVKPGDPIALVGNTGRSTGKHLHLECRIDGQLVDPASALPLK